MIEFEPRRNIFLAPQPSSIFRQCETNTKTVNYTTQCHPVMLIKQDIHHFSKPQSQVSKNARDYNRIDNGDNTAKQTLPFNRKQEVRDREQAWRDKSNCLALHRPIGPSHQYLLRPRADHWISTNNDWWAYPSDINWNCPGQVGTHIYKCNYFYETLSSSISETKAIVKVNHRAIFNYSGWICPWQSFHVYS